MLSRKPLSSLLIASFATLLLTFAAPAGASRRVDAGADALRATAAVLRMAEDRAEGMKGLTLPFGSRRVSQQQVVITLDGQPIFRGADSDLLEVLPILEDLLEEAPSASTQPVVADVEAGRTLCLEGLVRAQGGSRFEMDAEEIDCAIIPLR
jgi:hypothetical protein